jgi:altronate dehydratase large subunit
MRFLGFPRPDGRFGVRNHVAVVASVSCANGVVDAVHRELGVKKLTHTEGCGRGPQDLIGTTRTLMGLGKNPNVAAVLVVGLGCEFLKATMIAGGMSESKKPIETLVIQDSGGSQKTIEKAIAACRRLLDQAGTIEPTDCGWDALTVGFDCGALASESATASAPVLGACADWLVAQGARVIFAELASLVGPSPERGGAVTPEMGKKVAEALESRKRAAFKVFGEAGAARVTGGAGGGLAALGIRTDIQDVLDYGNPPAAKPGLYLMDSPESDAFAVTGLAAAGAQVIVQTTEHGNPAGFPIVPVVKAATRPRLFEQMEDDIDVDAARAGPPAQVGREIAEYVARVAAGEKSKSEANEYDLMVIQTFGPAF